ncbi:hypothetical protein [Clavibacter nebraskensis]|uniref:hypothetical protein n=1 Tax=Clavibacter nebraskensis TaxID=31963 RepID=UPI000344B780|nr:hypothetical protein [Clavibacter nebraskensis]KXU20943.1 hypothetical protein VV38_05720 [Clavibacter nebraskensis]OAH22345.1 hypothetical protein A3Q38_02845 [Clavibacter nebraskensis]
MTIVGIGGGTMEVGFGSIAFDAAVRIPYWGSRSELIEVFDLARSGQVTRSGTRSRTDRTPMPRWRRAPSAAARSSCRSLPSSP